jgi:hypothetical protein
MKKVRVNVEVGEADAEAVRVEAAMLGRSLGCMAIEHAIHRCLDSQGVPRIGRDVVVTLETIEISLPFGWEMAD